MYQQGLLVLVLVKLVNVSSWAFHDSGSVGFEFQNVTGMVWGELVAESRLAEPAETESDADYVGLEFQNATEQDFEMKLKWSCSCVYE